MPIEDSIIHPSVKIWHPELVNIFHSTIGEGCRIGDFTEIGWAVLGARVVVQAHVYICAGVTIGDDVFIGPGTIFLNDKYPPGDKLEWKPDGATVDDGASIGGGVLILPGVRIGRCMVGAGSVVTKDLPYMHGDVIYGVPARRR